MGDMSPSWSSPCLQMSLFGWSADPVTWYKVGQVTQSHGLKIQLDQSCDPGDFQSCDQVNWIGQNLGLNIQV